MNTRNKSGMTPLHLAAQKGSAPCVKVLVEAAAELNLQVRHTSSKIFCFAVNREPDWLDRPSHASPLRTWSKATQRCTTRRTAASSSAVSCCWRRARRTRPT